MSVSELLVPNTFNLYCNSIDNASGPVTGISAIEVPNSIPLYGASPEFSLEGNGQLATTNYVLQACQYYVPLPFYVNAGNFPNTVLTSDPQVLHTTPSVPVGLYDCTAVANLEITDLSNPVSVILECIVGTATASFIGGSGQTNIAAGSSTQITQTITLSFLMSVTVEGSIQFIASDADGNSTIIYDSPSYSGFWLTQVSFTPLVMH